MAAAEASGAGNVIRGQTCGFRSLVADTPGSCGGIEDAVRILFKAYDIDESGELSRDEFMKIEMRLCFEKGEIFDSGVNLSKHTKADKDQSGVIDFEEFRQRQFTHYTESGLSKDGVIEEVHSIAKAVLTERMRMGPRYHCGIRQALKKIFNLYDLSGDGNLSPEEWISAQRVVAGEICDDLDDEWVDERAFRMMDANADGTLDMEEYLEASFAMFEGVKERTDNLYSTLQRVITSLEKHRQMKLKETNPITLFLQSDDKPEFQPPHLAWQDEPTEEDQSKNNAAWKSHGATLKLPLHLTTIEEVASVVRLFLGMPSDTWISIFFVTPPRGDGGASTVKLLRGERPGEGNVQDALQYLSKPSAVPRLYVKNRRKRPQKLVRQIMAFMEDRQALLERRTGSCFGFDWETQILGSGSPNPPGPVVLSVGDALVVEVPKTDDSGSFTYVCSVFAERGDSSLVLSKPVDSELVASVGKKKKKKKGAAGSQVAGADQPEPDRLMQVMMVALHPGRTVMFVDVSWEDQEEKLTSRHRLTSPVAENTVARIGPLEVHVEPRSGAAKPGTKEPTVAKGDAAGFMWWNGEKWSNKKGPAKKGKRKK